MAIAYGGDCGGRTAARIPTTKSFSTPDDIVCSQPIKVFQRLRASSPLLKWLAGSCIKLISGVCDTAAITVSKSWVKVSPVSTGARLPEASASPSAILAKVTECTLPCASLWFSSGLVKNETSPLRLRPRVPRKLRRAFLRGYDGKLG